MRSEVEELLHGSFDFRIHTSPEPDGERRNDYLEAGRDAHEADMAGFVLMKHQYPTALLAYTLNRMYPGLNAIGSIALNEGVGGLNADAVEVSASLGAKVIWMPTRDADSTKLLDTPDKVATILDIAKASDLVVATTHDTFEESRMLLQLAKSIGVERLMLSNPLARFNSDGAKELLAFGTWVELPFFSYYPSDNAGERMRSDIEAIGLDRCIVSTDFGQWTNPPPVEGMRMAIAAMLGAGMDTDVVAKVVGTNPLELVGISDSG